MGSQSGNRLQRRPLVPKKSVDEKIFNSSHYLSLRAGPRQWLQWRHRLMSPALDLGVLNALNDDVVVEVDVEEALKSSIFIVQKAAAPKSGVEFCQDSIGTIRNSLATSCDVARRRTTSMTLMTMLS